MKSSRILLTVMGVAAMGLLAPMAVGAKVRTVTLLSKGSGTELQWNKAMIEAFEKANPGIKVRLITAETAEAYDPKLMGMIVAGQAPDVWSNLGYSGFMEFMARKFALDLTPYVTKDKYDFRDYMTMAVKPFTIKGRIMGLSYSTYSTVTYWNPDPFAEAGIPGLPSDWHNKDWSWDRMVEYARKLTLDKNNDGKPDRFGVTATFHLTDYALPWLFGGEYWNESTSRETGFPTKSTINTPEVAKAFEAKAGLYRKGLTGGDFAQKTCGMLIDATWRLDALKAARKLKWSVAPLPAGVPGHNSPTLYVDPWIVFRNSKNPDAAWKLVKFMCSKEMQELWVDLTGRMPSRKSVMPRFTAKHPGVSSETLVDVLAGSFEVGRQSLWNFTVNSNAYIRVLDPLVQRVWQGKLGVDQFVRQADDAVTKVIKTQGRSSM